jgi:PPOX class probable F420-dependent enzyme
VTVLPDSAREVLASDGLAHLVTLNPDGSPQVSCVWVGLEGDEIVCAHLGRFQKVKNIERDPRVTLSVEAPGENAIGMKHYLVVHGKARITEGGAPELLQKLAETYVGPGVKFPPMPAPPPGVVTRITPERVGGMGPWAASPT